MYREAFINVSFPMNIKFTKTKVTHHILPEFQKLLLEIEKQALISIFITRISPKYYNEELSWQ